MTHALGHVRQALLDWIETNDSATARATLYLPEVFEPTPQILAAPSDCPDTLPSDSCSLLELPLGSTYAQAVARPRLKRRPPKEAP